MFKLNLSNSVSYPVHNYSTRSCHNAVPSFQRIFPTYSDDGYNKRISQCKKSLSFNGPNIWNAIPLTIRCSSTLPSFKCKYREYLLNSYQSESL